MSTIRERVAEQDSGDGTPFPWVAEAEADRHALLAAGDALAEVADEVAWPWRDVVEPDASPMTRLLAAIAAWKEATG